MKRQFLASLLSLLAAFSFGAFPAAAQNSPNALAISSGVVTVSTSLGIYYFSLLLTANVTTFSFSGSPQNAQQVFILFKQDGTGGRTITWPSNVINPPAIATAANAITPVEFYYDTFSAQWYTNVSSPSLTDGVWNVPLGACNLSATTGAFAAAAAPAGANPAPVRVAAGNQVLQGVTTAAANVLQLECDITPPGRSTGGKGVSVTGLQLFYGVQTTALTSITAPTVNTVTYPATGGTAAGTVAAAGGALTVTPGTLQLATTTTGQCYSENISFATPASLTTALQRLTLEQIFNQTGAAATQLQICGVQVFYNNNPL